MTDDDLTQKIIGCAYTVHNTLGPGFLEKVYENALRIELEKQGFRVRQQEPIQVKRKFREYKPKGSLLNSILPAD